MSASSVVSTGKLGSSSMSAHLGTRRRGALPSAPDPALSRASNGGWPACTRAPGSTSPPSSAPRSALALARRSAPRSAQPTAPRSAPGSARPTAPATARPSSAHALDAPPVHSGWPACTDVLPRAPGALVPSAGSAVSTKLGSSPMCVQLDTRRRGALPSAPDPALPRASYGGWPACTRASGSTSPGAAVGAGAFAALGAAVGAADGAALGPWLGAADGPCDGVADGCDVGARVGTALGAAVGETDGDEMPTKTRRTAAPESPRSCCSTSPPRSAPRSAPAPAPRSAPRSARPTAPRSAPGSARTTAPATARPSTVVYVRRVLPDLADERGEELAHVGEQRRLNGNSIRAP
jgi:hypothetical protein